MNALLFVIQGIITFENVISGEIISIERNKNKSPKIQIKETCEYLKLPTPEYINLKMKFINNT